LLQKEENDEKGSNYGFFLSKHAKMSKKVKNEEKGSNNDERGEMYEKIQKMGNFWIFSKEYG
jgi:hypothetical protein